MKKQELTKRVKQLILKDIMENIVSNNVKSYEELSEYVDPNMYFINSGYDYNGTDEDNNFLNEQIDVIDNWLKTILTQDIVVYSHDTSIVYYKQGADIIFYVETKKNVTKHYIWENMKQISQLEFDTIINHHYTIV